MQPKIVFFGTPHIAVAVLNELEKSDLVPSLVVTNPDRCQGRKMVITPSPVKVWALERIIEIIQPETLEDNECVKKLKTAEADLFVVVAYGKIIPKEILEISKHGTLNMHPSLLPRLRGASPIRSAILTDERETGVTVMLLDEEMDHGPIVAQKEVSISKDEWPLRGRNLDALLAQEGGKLLAETIPRWIDGSIKPKEQDHSKATFCSKITKDMSEINLQDDPYQNLLKIRAFDGWPGTFFWHAQGEKKIRVKIVDAELDSDGSLKIIRVTPEGRSEVSYTDFMRH